MNKYIELMSTIRSRFEYIHFLKSSKADAFFVAEHAAFHGRKIVEGIAFGCMVVVEHGIKTVPKDVKGKWEADRIIKSLERKGILSLPSPNIMRPSSEEEKKQHKNIEMTLEGQPERRVSVEELCLIYRRFHRWAHEINPYVVSGRESFVKKHEKQLWTDLVKIERLLDRHIVFINRDAFFCILKDKVDGMVKVIPLSKEAAGQ